jgi:hypothetical protein
MMLQSNRNLKSLKTLFFLCLLCLCGKYLGGFGIARGGNTTTKLNDNQSLLNALQHAFAGNQGGARRSFSRGRT